MKFVTLKMRTIILCFAVAAIFVGLLVGAAVTDSARMWRGEPVGRQPVFAAGVEDGRVGLAFEVHGNGEFLEQIVDVLLEHDVRATFFVTGFWANRHPEKLLALSQAGMEIGTLGNTHIDMTRLRQSVISLELNVSAAAITTITGSQVTLFRPPHGRHNHGLVTTAEEEGFRVIMGDIDKTNSIISKTPEQISLNVLPNLQKGSIIVLRSDRRGFAESLPLVLSGIRNSGKCICTVGELIG